MYWSPSPLLELEQHLLALEIRVLCVGLPYHMQAFWVVREQSITALFCRLGARGTEPQSNPSKALRQILGPKHTPSSGIARGSPGCEGHGVLLPLQLPPISLGKVKTSIPTRRHKSFAQCQVPDPPPHR